MFRLRMIGKIIRQAGLGHITLVFFGIFFLCALAVELGQPSIGSYGDALWLCFQTVTTIGFGDVPAQGALCRAALVFLSIVSIFYLAVITGVVELEDWQQAFEDLLDKKGMKTLFTIGGGED